MPNCTRQLGIAAGCGLKYGILPGSDLWTCPKVLKMQKDGAPLKTYFVDNVVGLFRVNFFKNSVESSSLAIQATESFREFEP